MNYLLQENSAANINWSKFVLPVLFFIMLSVDQVLCSSANAAEVKQTNAQQLKRGKVVADKFCSLCHGKKLQGQSEWKKRKENGRLPAPPLDGTGHTWHHADQLLFDIIKFGIVPPHGPPDYDSDMPAWGATLSDEDIWAVLTYIKSVWPEEAQKIQKEINQDSLKRLD